MEKSESIGRETVFYNANGPMLGRHPHEALVVSEMHKTNPESLRAIFKGP